MEDEILDLEEDQQPIPAYYSFIGMMRLSLLTFFLYRLIARLIINFHFEDIAMTEILTVLFTVGMFWPFTLYNGKQGLLELRRSPASFDRIRYRAFSVVIATIICLGAFSKGYFIVDGILDWIVLQNMAIALTLGVLIFFDIKYARRAA